MTGSGAAPGSQTYEGMEGVATLGPAPPRQPLRRPFASILAEINLPPRRAMYLIGHTDPTLTMRVYQQVIDMGDGGLEAREKLVGCTLERPSHCFRPGGFVHQLFTGRKKGLPPRAVEWAGRR